VSTEQKKFTETDPAILSITEEMLDGRLIGGVRPVAWRADTRAEIPGALARLASRLTELDEVGDTEIGGAFFRELRQHAIVTPVFTTEFGAYLRGKAALLAGEPGGIPAYPALPPQLAPDGMHEEVGPLIKAWATNGVEDVHDNVDAQAAYLLTLGPPRPWLNDSCRGDAWAKDFLGRVMDYKRAMLTPLTPVVGMRLTVDERLNRGAYFVLGTEITVTEVGVRNFSAVGDCDFGGDGQISPDSSQSLFVPELRQYHLVQGSDSEPVAVEGATVEEPTNVVVAALNERVTELTASLARLEEQVERLTTALNTERDNHQNDIDVIGEALIEEARRRDWCSEYDTVMGRISSRLTIPLPERTAEEIDHEIEVSGWVRVPFSVTVTVTAAEDADWDDLCRQAGEDVENNYSARQLMTDYGDAYNGEVEDDFDFQRP
jgi:hypothetical protein